MSTQLDTGVYPLDDNCGQSQCNGDYATLGGYSNKMGQYVAGAPVPSQTAVQSVVITPSYGGSGYNVLNKYRCALLIVTILPIRLVWPIV